jgi:Asp-tRNA(Asn)/Glu-tRNA(Gln) amidotransferase A subunit family amidase
MPGILLTTDLSDESKRAFAPVRELAKRLQLDVTLLAVMEEPLLGAAPGGVFAQFPDRERVRADLRAAVRQRMDTLRLDALVYPTWSNPPRLIGDLNTPHGDNSQLFSPTTGFPALQVPMGYTRAGQLPAGITFFGRPWDEATLFRLGFA